MNRNIILVLAGIAVIGLLALYALQQGPVLLLHPPAEERIAFVSDRGGSPDIWTMRADGSDARRVTDDAYEDQMPSWSPDGREIVAVSDRSQQVFQVFLSAWDGRYTRILTSSEGTKNAPVWDSDGSMITFLSGARVAGVPRTGGREEQYLPPGGATGLDLPGRMAYDYAAWSPDRQTLLYVQDTDQACEAYVVTRADLDAYDGQSLKNAGITAAKGLNVAWSPSDNRIAVSFVDRGGESGILVADVAAEESKDILLSKPGTAPGRIAWSPDGKSIAFELWKLTDYTPDRSLGIYVISAAGGAPRKVSAGDLREPSWSPDGKRLAYTKMGKGEKRDIWAVDLGGSSPVNLTNGNGDNSSPTWSPSPK